MQGRNCMSREAPPGPRNAPERTHRRSAFPSAPQRLPTPIRLVSKAAGRLGSAFRLAPGRELHRPPLCAGRGAVRRAIEPLRQEIARVRELAEASRREFCGGSGCTSPPASGDPPFWLPDGGGTAPAIPGGPVGRSSCTLRPARRTRRPPPGRGRSAAPDERAGSARGPRWPSDRRSVRRLTDEPKRALVF